VLNPSVENVTRKVGKIKARVGVNQYFVFVARVILKVNLAENSQYKNHVQMEVINALNCEMGITSCPTPAWG
jgi:hypothetical protein